MEEKSRFTVTEEVYSAKKKQDDKETVWGYVFGRKLALLVLPFFLKTGLSANQISIIAIVIGVVGTFLIIVGEFWFILLGALLIQIWHVFDYVDGMVARYKKAMSSFGEFLEGLHELVMGALFFSSIGFAASKFPGMLPPFIELPPHAFIVFGMATSFCVTLRHLLWKNFESVFPAEEKPSITLRSSAGLLPKIYQQTPKFLGVHSLAQPFFMLALIFQLLGLYILVYFMLHTFAFLSNVIVITWRAKHL